VKSGQNKKSKSAETQSCFKRRQRVTHEQNQSDIPKHHITKHLVLPVFFNEPPDLTGWCEGAPGAGRVVAVKSVLFSDGSAKRFYKMAALKKKKKRKHR
jgi:hypothetical protein